MGFNLDAYGNNIRADESESEKKKINMGLIDLYRCIKTLPVTGLRK